MVYCHGRIDTRLQYLPELRRTGAIIIYHTPGTEHFADIDTKYVDLHTLHHYLPTVGLNFAGHHRAVVNTLTVRGRRLQRVGDHNIG